MPIKTRLWPWLTLAGIVLFLGGVFWGAWFAFPYPDASPDEAARMRVHERVATSAMLLGLLCTLVGGMATIRSLLRSWLQRRNRRT